MDSDFGYCIKVYDMIRHTGLQEPSGQCDAKFINQSNNYAMVIHSTQLEGVILKKFCYIYIFQSFDLNLQPTLLALQI